MDKKKYSVLEDEAVFHLKRKESLSYDTTWMNL
jgi:hypothetical protein